MCVDVYTFLNLYVNANVIYVCTRFKFWLYAVMFSWWCVCVCLPQPISNRFIYHTDFSFAPFLLFIVQLFKLFVVIQNTAIHQFSFRIALTLAVGCRNWHRNDTEREKLLGFYLKLFEYLILEVWPKCKHLRSHCVDMPLPFAHQPFFIIPVAVLSLSLFPVNVNWKMASHSPLPPKIIRISIALALCSFAFRPYSTKFGISLTSGGLVYERFFRKLIY